MSGGVREQGSLTKRIVEDAKLATTSWVIVTFGEAGDTVCFRMYIMSYEP
jgi:hypothetical protein